MPSTPTTKSQVQAHQFVLRRMQSALVRKDPVMLHEPMRTHSRATIVGAVLAALGMLGFAIFGLIKPAPTPPATGIVIGEQSGAVYVKTNEPPRLIPTFNVASARLLMLAQQRSTGNNVAPNANAGAVKIDEPRVVPDEQLIDIPRGRLTGIPDAPQLLPKADQRVSDHWAVCDLTKIDSSLPPPVGLAQAQTETTVFAGVASLGRELAVGEALLAKADSGESYLVYRQDANPNRPDNTVRARVEADKPAIAAALRLSPDKLRRISTGMLNAIPEVGELKAPDIAGKGVLPLAFNLAGLKVGEVFAVSRAATRDYWVVLPQGIQEISEAVADVMRYENSQGKAGPIVEVTPDQLQRVPQVRAGEPGALAVMHYPQEVPTVLEPAPTPLSCLGWSVVNSGTPQEDGHTAVYVGSQLPKIKNARGDELTPLTVGQRNSDGIKVDRFYLQPGRAAVIRAATSKTSFATGPISLISDRGLRYGVPDVATANALGLTDPRPAPEAIIRLLPTGASLNTSDVQQSYNSAPTNPTLGTFPSSAPK